MNTQLVGVGRPFTRVLDFFGLLIVLISASVLFFSLAPLDPDPHHDGFQLAVALAIAQNRQVHLEVFNQYGPVTAEIHAAVLDIFGQELITLRLFNAALLVVTAVLGYIIARLLKLPVIPSVVAVVLWISLSPAGGVFGPELQLWPWPSVVFTLLAQFFLLLVLVLLRHPTFTWMWVLLGMLITLLLVTRINQGIPLIAFVWVALSLARETRLWLRTHLIQLMIGIAVGVGILAGYLVSRSDAKFFIIDSVTGPVMEYVVRDAESTAQVLKPVDVFRVFSGSFILAALPFIIVGTGLFMLLRRRATSQVTCYIGSCVSLGLMAVVASLGYYGRTRDALIQIVGTAIDLSFLNAHGS